jgi:hypothetical protein
LDVGLFKVCEHGNYYSERMLEYKSRRVNASEQAQAAIKKRWENQRLNTTVLPPNYDRNTGSNTKESRVEESRVEESRVEESRVEKKKEKRAQAPFIAPTFEEYEGYCKEHGFIGIARRSFDGYAAADWHDSQGSPVRNWRQKLCNVWFLDEHKDKPVEVRKPYKGGL